ncbi:MAG: hypothetical protein JSS87_07090 [Acidobacteria bacterium]|nr:hypothetical protein [Acidobacteriota bacterium]
MAEKSCDLSFRDGRSCTPEQISQSQAGGMVVLKRIGLLMIGLIFLVTGLSAQTPKVRISAWYWLNSAPKTDWQGDFITMKNMGFTDVLLGWGLDAAGVATRISDTQKAIRLAHQAGMGAYLIVWHPHANSLTRRPEFMQIDSEGHVLKSFDVFNPEWRSTQWKTYIQKVAKAYGTEPGFSGYVFDDSFGAGGNGVVSYGAYEKKAFGEPLPTKPDDPRWDAWEKARQGWWEDWARDTTKYIRAIDPNHRHQIYLEDHFPMVVNPKRLSRLGLDFGRVAKHFDAVGGYTSARWSSDPDSGQKAAQLTPEAIEGVRKYTNPRQEIIYTFWVANQAEERLPGAAMYPTADQIKLICEAALKLGIRHIDMYGYRIGEYILKPDQTMADMVPPDPAPYKLTGQFPLKFLWDRPEVHQGLADYLKSLNR